MPKFVIDEDMPRSLGKLLKNSGFDAKDIRDYGLRGAGDSEIFKFARENKAVLVSGDLGFGNILVYPLDSHWGIVIAHFPNEMTTDEISRQLIKRIQELQESDFKGNLMIMEPGRVRIKRK
ncbi:MAG: DUF5615 family PIN-like protein [Deltaproteobacteria bacterium]|nr:DUF5615 family PIN-like protein [Deltaproteobacteria bacterium]